MSDSTMGGGGVLPSPPLELPSSMPGFRQTGACVETSRTLNLGTGRVPRARSFPVLEIPGETLCPAPAACPVCGGRTRPNGAASCRLAHLPFGGSWSVVTVCRPRARRTRCGASARAPAPFRAPGRTATLALVRLVEDLLAYGLTPTDVAPATGLCRQVVREIDRERLARLHTRPTPDGGREPSPPAARSRLLGVDEFKLHDGHRYATVVPDPESGHVLWLARARRLKRTKYPLMASRAPHANNGSARRPGHAAPPRNRPRSSAARPDPDGRPARNPPSATASSSPRTSSCSPRTPSRTPPPWPTRATTPDRCANWSNTRPASAMEPAAGTSPGPPACSNPTWTASARTPSIPSPAARPREPTTRSRPSDANTTDYPTTNTSSSGSWTPAGKNNDGSPGAFAGQRRVDNRD